MCADGTRRHGHLGDRSKKVVASGGGIDCVNIRRSECHGSVLEAELRQSGAALLSLVGPGTRSGSASPLWRSTTACALKGVIVKGQRKRPVTMLPPCILIQQSWLQLCVVVGCADYLAAAVSMPSVALSCARRHERKWPAWHALHVAASLLSAGSLWARPLTQCTRSQDTRRRGTPCSAWGRRRSRAPRPWRSGRARRARRSRSRTTWGCRYTRARTLCVVVVVVVGLVEQSRAELSWRAVQVVDGQSLAAAIYTPHARATHDVGPCCLCAPSNQKPPNAQRDAPSHSLFRRIRSGATPINSTREGGG